MINVRQVIRGTRFVAVLAAALAISACAKNDTENSQANAGAMATPGSQQDFLVNVGDRVWFETDSSELSAKSRETLDKQAQWLTNYNRYAFTIEGHADERGTREYNLALGQRRSEAVRSALKLLGVQDSQIEAVSFGKEKPVDPGSTEEAWAKNRRAEIVYR